MEKLDSISMQLIAIGENSKNFDKVTSKKYCPYALNKLERKGNWHARYHHSPLFRYHAEAIFDVCQNHIGKLKKSFSKISKEI